MCIQWDASDLKVEWSTDLCYDIDELWKHYTKKLDTKGYIFYDFIYVKYPE